MALNDIEIDWEYVLERIERLFDLAEEYFERQLPLYEPDPALFREHLAYRWQGSGEGGILSGVAHPDLPEAADLLGIDRALETLFRNTRQFVAGAPSNNVLLWGERGTGKSSAIKSLLREFAPQGLRLVEVQKEDLFHLPVITGALREQPFRFILFCDDLSFDESEIGYRELKALLEGGVEARPENVRVYATSNRRHLLPERMEENTGGGEIHPEEAISEKLSLSDRFGLALGFYPVDQELYLAIVRHLARRRKLRLTTKRLEREALQWALDRGARSGRVARQFIDDLAGQMALASSSKPKEP